ncbi:hypothetical protein H632_c3767p0, partial [Helicosporidium sp. ATCC 50920]
EREEGERREREVREHQEREDARRRRLERLANEPDKGEGVATIMIRLPSGSRCTRRFRGLDSAQLVFDFVDVEAQATDALAPGSYALVSQYPRCEIDPSSSATLASLGLGSGQVALFVRVQ